MKCISNKIGLSISCLAFVFCVGFSTVHAVDPIIDPGTYRIFNHPDGNAAPPLYGLRLDGLVNGNTNNMFLFDFDGAGANMQLTYDDSGSGSAHIFGTAIGNLKQGGTVTPLGLFAIDFQYNDISQVPGENGLQSFLSNPLDTGSITSITNFPGFTRDLFEFVGNSSLPTFHIDDNHRGVAGPSGWGWLNHSGSRHHVYASDWLFKIDPVPVPEPETYAVMASFLAFGIALRRRRGVMIEDAS